MSQTITGTIKTIGQTEQPTEKFTKRTFILDVQDGNYTNQVALQFTQDKVGKLDEFTIGQDVRVHFNIRSREWNGKWFTELTAYGIGLNTPQATDYSNIAKDNTGVVTNGDTPMIAATPGIPPVNHDADSQLPF